MTGQFEDVFEKTLFTVGDDMREFYENEADSVIRRDQERCRAEEEKMARNEAPEEETPEEAAAKAAAAFFKEEMEEAGEPAAGSDEAAESAGEADETTAAESGETAGAGQNETDGADEKEAAGADPEKKQGKKDPRDEKIEDLSDRLKRSLAEFDNFRKRTEKEKAAMFDMGAKSVLEKLLPTIDNFERALNTVPESDEAKAYAEGMHLIYRQFLKNMEEAGVKPMDCQGQPFDPNFHNAVMHVEDENLGENVIAEEFQKGYLYKDSVLRHSMVKVAN